MATLIDKESRHHRFDTTGVVDGDLFNNRLVHSESGGLIRPINFIEPELLNYQMIRYPMISHPTEFHGLILLNKYKDSVRIYYAGSDQPWPPKPAVILDSVKLFYDEFHQAAFHPACNG